MQENKVYVGNLPYSVNNEQLGALFAEYGEVVEAVVITERDSGRSKGFGFVTFNTADEAQASIAALHESEFGGRKLVVNIARPKAE